MKKESSPEVGYGFSLLKKEKISHLIELLKSVDSLEGSVAEVGVYRAGTAVQLAKNTFSKIYLFDTFEGMPYYSEKDKDWDRGSFSDVNLDAVMDLFKDYSNVEIHKGIFPIDTGWTIKDKQFKFVHLDVDNYDSYKQSLSFFYEKVVKGGIISFDDYDHICCPGANLAIDEFLKGKELLRIEKNAYIIKE